MATQAHCAYCFESLAASLERRQPLSLSQVEELWDQYHADTARPGKNDIDVAGDNVETDGEDDDAEMTDFDNEVPVRPAAISRLLNRNAPNSAASSSSSLPSSSKSSSSMQSHPNASATETPASSMSSRSSLLTSKRTQPGEEHPLFVTWNTVSRSGHKSLRGCIGTFEAQELGDGLRSYALTSAFEDVRFQPIPASLLPSLCNDVTLLTNFAAPTKDAMDWTLGKHGLRISFGHHGRRYSSTYLPDVAREQGWTKEETLISLMRKAGWNGSGSAWQKTWRDGRGELITYEGKPAGLSYREWKAWRDWVDR